MGSDFLPSGINTSIIPVSEGYNGRWDTPPYLRSLGNWAVPSEQTEGLKALQHAANLLRTSDIPVAFPTETVYGLGADATRSSAVRGIYAAKGRPSDNPLIIHICDISMLSGLLGSPDESSDNVIPEIYKPIVACFWPGPVTIILPNPPNSKLAPEVTAGGRTFGVRMPRSNMALTLIKLAGVPIAAPSANASTKPSTTTAQHVLQDLNGKIEIILDGGPCEIGVESTVIDGTCDPPSILRPGGISMEAIRACAGWENVQKGYKDVQQFGEIPKAPGMKYKHYSPKAKVILVENSPTAVPVNMAKLKFETGRRNGMLLTDGTGGPCKIGILSTVAWDMWGGWNHCDWLHFEDPFPEYKAALSDGLPSSTNTPMSAYLFTNEDNTEDRQCVAQLFAIPLGSDHKLVAQGLFSALRDLDAHGVDVIYVEGVFADDDGTAAAIMNRLRKAATIIKV